MPPGCNVSSPETLICSVLLCTLLLWELLKGTKKERKEKEKKGTKNSLPYSRLILIWCWGAAQLLFGGLENTLASQCLEVRGTAVQLCPFLYKSKGKRRVSM